MRSKHTQLRLWQHPSVFHVRNGARVLLDCTHLRLLACMRHLASTKCAHENCKHQCEGISKHIGCTCVALPCTAAHLVSSNTTGKCICLYVRLLTRSGRLSLCLNRRRRRLCRRVREPRARTCRFQVLPCRRACAHMHIRWHATTRPMQLAPLVNVCVYLCMFVCVCGACVCGHMHACIHEYEHAHMSVYVCVYTQIQIHFICVHVYLCIHMYVCIYVYIYIYIPTYICTYVCVSTYIDMNTITSAARGKAHEIRRCLQPVQFIGANGPYLAPASSNANIL
jgi:hypothetical protein